MKRRHFLLDARLSAFNAAVQPLSTLLAFRPLRTVVVDHSLDPNKGWKGYAVFAFCSGRPIQLYILDTLSESYLGAECSLMRDRQMLTGSLSIFTK